MIFASGALAAALALGQTALPVAISRQTLLPIDLVGVIVNRHAPEKSVCLLRSSTPARMTEMAQPGDTVFQLAIVQAVEPEKVLLKNLATNDIEDLGFWKTKPLAVTPPPPLQAALPAIAPSAAQENGIVIPKSVVDHYRTNLKEFLDSATAAPHFRDEGGQRVIDGFEISSIKKGAIVDQLGFRLGDVIIEANGTRLDSLDKVLSLYQKSLTATRVDLIVLREGKRQTISFRQK